MKQKLTPEKKQQRISGLSRRNFLSGLGACIALPAMESLLPRSAMGATLTEDALATTATGAPLRTAFVYFPNGAIPADWWPSGDGAAYTMSKTLQALTDSRGMFQVLKGLDHKTAIGGIDGAGDHARANATFLTGVRVRKSATDIHAGVSIDQVMAREIGHLTRLSSLELSCDQVRASRACDSGYSCAYVYNVSWSSETTPMTPEVNPRLAFERMFGTGDHGQRWENFRRRQAAQRSILDFVTDDTRLMNRRAGSKDKEKLDQYLTGVRDIETRIERAEKMGKTEDPNCETPSGIPMSYAEYVDLMYDMLVLAFQTDSTRIATLLLAHDGSNRSFDDIGVSEGHHDLSHHFGKQELIAKVQKIDTFYVERFARFLKKLDGVKDLDGNSVLYNSQIVYGSGNADGNRHSHTDLPIVLAGAGGGTLRTGRYVNHNGTAASNLFVSMAHAAGLKSLNRFGDSTGTLTNL